MTGSAAQQTRSTPKKLVSICARASAMGVSSTGPIKAQPALLTTASRRPVFSAMAETARVTDSSSFTRMGSVSAPRNRVVWGRLVPNTRHPRAARWRAMACPIPEEAPVTRTTFRLAGALIGLLSQCEDFPHRSFLRHSDRRRSGGLLHLSPSPAMGAGGRRPQPGLPDVACRREQGQYGREGPHKGPHPGG